MARRYVDFAAYAYLAQARNLNWNKIADLIDDSVFNGLTFMGRNQWLQRSEEMFDAQKYNKTAGKFVREQNNEWFEKVEEVFELLMKRKIGITYKFFDEYLPPHYKIPAGKHPMVHNNFGALDAKELYDSWIQGRGHTWIKWDDDPIRNFQPCSEAGEVHMAYIERMVSIIARLKAKYPGAFFAWSAHNETEGSALGGRFSLGDRPEVHIWIRELFKKNDLVQGARFKSYVNYNAVDTADQTEWNRMMKTQYTGCLSKPAFHKASAMEIHNVGEDHMVPDLIKLFGPNSAKKLRGSTDSVQKPDNNKANKHLYDSELINIELKPEERNWGKKFLINNLQKSVNFFIPALSNAVK